MPELKLCDCWFNHTTRGLTPWTQEALEEKEKVIWMVAPLKFTQTSRQTFQLCRSMPHKNTNVLIRPRITSQIVTSALQAVSDKFDLNGEPIKMRRRWCQGTWVQPFPLHCRNRNHSASDERGGSFGLVPLIWDHISFCFHLLCGRFVPSVEGGRHVSRGAITGRFKMSLKAHLHLEMITCVKTVETSPS